MIQQEINKQARKKQNAKTESSLGDGSYPLPIGGFKYF